MNRSRCRPHRAAMALATLFLVAHPAARGEDDPLKHHTIVVSGTGSISAQPDIAEIGVGVITQAPNAKDALAANNEAASRLVQILKERGIAEKDIQTSQIQVSPQYSQPPGNAYAPTGAAPNAPPAREFIPRVIGYRVENSVQIVARRIDQLGPLLDAVVQGGANNISGISFRVEHPEKLFDVARKRAMADAKHQAELLAGEAGVVVGAPLKIESLEGYEPPSPRAYGVAAMMAPAAPSMPVSPGEQKLTARVSVISELKTPVK